MYVQRCVYIFFPMRLVKSDGWLALIEDTRKILLVTGLMAIATQANHYLFAIYRKCFRRGHRFSWPKSRFEMPEATSKAHSAVPMPHLCSQ